MSELERKPPPLPENGDRFEVYFEQLREWVISETDKALDRIDQKLKEMDEDDKP
jgi:hypothetical protein